MNVVTVPSSSTRFEHLDIDCYDGIELENETMVIFNDPYVIVFSSDERKPPIEIIPIDPYIWDDNELSNLVKILENKTSLKGIKPLTTVEIEVVEG